MEQVYFRSSAPAASPRSSGGLEKDLLRAAEGGNADAQCNLGILYGNGVDDNNRTIEGNGPQAVKWLLAAAEQGLARAQLQLAEMYADEPDIAGSHTAACGWFLLAARGLRGVHLQRALIGYARVASQLSQKQIAKATAFARDRAAKRDTRAADLASPKNHVGGRET
jgi:TPR repeat protein